MKATWIKGALCAALVAALTACGGSDDTPSSPVLVVDSAGTSTINTAALSATLATYPAMPASTAEAQSLTFMRQEEQLAHDVYSVSATQYPQQIFVNIAAAETTHAAAVKLLLDRYQLPDPLAGLGSGQYLNSTIQALYTQFVAASAVNLVEALKVGVQIEELDIRDLTQQLTLVDNPDIVLVYQNLMQGSRNHLRSFMKVLTQQGGTYVPQYLSQTDFDAIVNSPMEAGH